MTRAAAHAAGWATTRGRKSPWVLSPSGSAGSRAIQGPNDPIGLRVEILMGAYGWVDVSSSTYYRDRVRISRGRSNETSQPPPQTAGLTLNNRGGIFTPRNAAGPYYGLIGRNTPIRVSRTWNGERFYRYTGEIPAWPTTSDISGRDVYEQITASGPLRRLVQGTQPQRSPMYRAYTRGATASNVIAYWPCEDAVAASSFASGIPGGTPMTFAGAPQLAQNTSFTCSSALPVTNSSQWSAFLPSFTGSTANVLRFLISVPPAGEIDDSGLALIETTGTVAYLQLLYAAANGGSLTFWGLDVNLNTLFLSTGAFGVNGHPSRVSMELVQAGTNINWACLVLQAGQQSATSVTGSIPGTIGEATSLLVSAKAGSVPASTAIGHVSYQPTWDSLNALAQPLNSWTGEPPDAAQVNDSGFTTSRFTRLCLEQNINPVVVSSALGYDVDPGPTAPVGMGPQPVDTFPSMIQQVPDTASAIMFEPRDQVGVAIRTRASLYNQTPRLTLDHSQHQLAAPLNPLDDDQQVRNDIVVSRLNGSSATAVEFSGPLSIQDPPNGVGDYENQYELSLASDGLLADAAGWRLHLGTVNEPRYPTISLNLRHPSFTNNSALMNAVLALDIGDRIVIVNPPSEFPPDPISLIVQGYTEILGVYEHDMVINCSPESPYEVALLDDAVLGHLDTDGSMLFAAYPLGTEATIQVSTASPVSPLWTTVAGDFPFDIAVAGERMTVTNITGAASPQTFTVTRSANGVVKPQSAGADVRLWQPMILSL